MRAEPVFRSRLLLSQGNGMLQKCLHSPVLGSRQTHREREVRAWALLQSQCSPCARASLPMAGATLNAIQKISAFLSLLRERSIGSGGGISRRDAALQAGLLQSTASAPAPPVPGWQVSPTIISWSGKAGAAAWLVLVCRRGVMLPTIPCCPSDLEHPPQIWFGGCPALLLGLEACIILIQA